MKHDKRLLITLTIVLISLLAAPAAYSDESSRTPATPIPGLTIPASQLPSYYPARFQATGVIFRVEGDGRLIVSGLAQAYTLATNAPIHSMATEHSSRHALRKGVEIGFSVDDKNRRMITEIWILPKGAIRPS